MFRFTNVPRARMNGPFRAMILRRVIDSDGRPSGVKEMSHRRWRMIAESHCDPCLPPTNAGPIGKIDLKFESSPCVNCWVTCQGRNKYLEIESLRWLRILHAIKCNDFSDKAYAMLLLSFCSIATFQEYLVYRSVRARRTFVYFISSSSLRLF